MAIIKPEQLSTGSYSITGSFTGSFIGDGSGLNNIPQEILKYSSSIDFPSPSGSIDYLYLDQSANLLYAWDAAVSQYTLLNSSTVAPTTGSEGELYFADLATTSRLANNTYNNGVSGSGATLIGTSFGALGQFNQPGQIDNTTPLSTDIILVRSETTTSRNGLYEITDLGSPSSSYVLTRVSYYDTGSEMYPSQVTVLRGLSLKNQTFIQQTDNPVVGSSPIIFAQAPSTATQILPILFIDTVTTAPLPAATYATGSGYTGYPGYQATLTANAVGALGVIGGVTASSNTRILVVSESNSVNNGSYVVTAPGSATTKWRLQRLDYWSSIQPNNREFVVSRFGATEYGSRYVLQSSSITPSNIGISQSLVFQRYLSPGSGGSSTPAFPFTGSAFITGSLGITGSLSTRAQGALSTDIAFGIRNSANTLNILTINGLGRARFGFDVAGTEFITIDPQNGTISMTAYGSLTHTALTPSQGYVGFGVTAYKFGVGTNSPAARLDVRAQGALSTDIAFRIRNSADTFNVFSIAGNNSLFFTGSATITGSVSISNVLTLVPQSPLPTGVETGSFAVSSSIPPKPYFWDGSTWNALY